MDTKKRKVMVFGTFDIFHPGHESFLKQAKKYGDYLIVVIARDKTVKSVKSRKQTKNEKERKKVVEKSGLVDKSVLGGITNKYAVIRRYKPETICLGYDQKIFTENLENWLKKVGLEHINIKRMKPFKPQKYKSSIIAKRGVF